MFDLSDDVIEIRDWVREFGEKEIRPHAEHYDETEETPWPVLEKAAEVGIYGMEFWANTFMGDPSGLMLPVVTEELFWADAGIALSIQGTLLGVMGLMANGTPEQIGEWIPKAFGVPGDLGMACWCMTEPNAGSDVGSLRTKAERDGDEWILNGTKVFITNGGIADVHVVVATVDPALGHRGQATFVVPKGTPGLRQGKKEKKLGIRASHTAEVIFEDCRIPMEYLLGGPDKLEAKLERGRTGQSAGKSGGLATLEASRPAVAAQAIGVARAAYEFALQYATEREQFGKPIIDNQGVAFKLADMATDIDASRLLTYRAAWMARNGKPFAGAEGSMAKLKASETAVRVTEQAVQILGGYGYIREYPVERYFRDAKIFTIYEGTSEIQRLVISRALRRSIEQS